MGKTTIEWVRNTDGTPGWTFNPWIGCTHVSPGCVNCYAETLMDQRYGRVEWGKGKARLRTSVANWRKPLAWNKQAAKDGVRARVFCSSLADVFDEEVDQVWRMDLFNLILQTPALDWLLLTKRPQNIRHMVPGDWMAPKGAFKVLPYAGGFPDNIWVGTSVEDQRRADERIPELLKVPARVRFLSCEPLLGAVNIEQYLAADYFTGNADYPYSHIDGIHWVIVGGESGHSARPMGTAWARSLRDQCQAAGVAFHFKQWGEYTPYYEQAAAGGQIVLTEYPNGGMKRVGKKAAGRQIDGRTWDEVPQ